MKKILVAIVILIGISLVIHFASRDIAPPDVADLIVDRPEVSSNENAYTYFDLATNSFYMPTNSSIVTDYLEGEPVSGEEILDVIARNEEMLGRIDEGVQCRICLAPEIEGFDTLIPYVATWRGMGRVMAVKAKQRRLSGNHAEAALSCVSLLRFGDLLQHDAECIINYLVGLAVLEIGLQQARDLALDEGSTECELSALSAALVELGPFDHGLIRAIKVEYRMAAKTIDDMASGEFTINELASLSGVEASGVLKTRLIPKYFFQPNKTKARFAVFYRNMISNAPLVYAEMDLYDVEEAFGLDEGKAKLMTRPNGVGKILCALMVPALESLLERKCRTETSVAATSLLVALQSYEHSKGAFPATAQELVPDCIPAIPSDPYDGQPFRYERSKGIVYSIGKDLKDSGGSLTLVSGDESDPPGTKQWKAEDVVFGIEKKDP